MADMPIFVAMGAPRCCHRQDVTDHTACARVARWMGPPNDLGQRLFYCDRHRTAADEELAGEQLVRRVSVTLEVIFCGTSRTPVYAQAEAYAQLERAIAAIGGVVNLHDVRSVLGRYSVPWASGELLRSGGKG